MATILRPSGDKPRAGPAQTGIHPGFIKSRDKGFNHRIQRYRPPRKFLPPFLYTVHSIKPYRNPVYIMNWISVRFYGMSDTILKSYTIKSTFFLMVQNNDKKKTFQYVETNNFFFNNYLLGDGSIFVPFIFNIHSNIHTIVDTRMSKVVTKGSVPCFNHVLMFIIAIHSYIYRHAKIISTSMVGNKYQW